MRFEWRKQKELPWTEPLATIVCDSRERFEHLRQEFFSHLKLEGWQQKLEKENDKAK